MVVARRFSRGLILTLVWLCAGAEAKDLDATIKTSDWLGYPMQEFTVDGHAASVVQPKLAAPGKPWVWRMSSADYHTEVDQELLRCGWHVAQLDVMNLLGCDAALDAMDRFYDRVRADRGLAAKPALEAVSHGGLPAYRYADRHPERVACLYAENPVMDLKSWPQQWRDGQAQMMDALNYYGFPDTTALMAYSHNPLDLLATIAKANIPLRHIVSLNDEVVPPAANTLEAQRRLRVLRHTLEVVTVAQGTPESHGDHFPPVQVFESARFIARHSYVLPGDGEYYALRDGLANARATFLQKKTGRVAFLGGSITFNPGWRDELMRYFQARFPDTQFEFIAAGIPSVGANGHAFRLQRDVLTHGAIDLIFVEAAVNDTANCVQRPVERLRGMEGVVRQLRRVNPLCDIVELQFVDPQHIEAYKADQVPDTVLQHERVAAHYGCPSLNLSGEVAERIAAGEFTWADDFIDVHPSAYGQQVYANSMMRMLDAAFASAGTPAAHALPAQPLDPFSYEHGHFGRLEDVQRLSGFQIDPNWCPTDGKETRAGFVNVPALVGTQPGDTFEYAFEGRGVGLFVAAGPDAGQIEVCVDGGTPFTLDTFSRWSAGLHLPWVVMLADELPTGRHVVRVRIAPDHHPRSVGTALRVIQLLVN